MTLCDGMTLSSLTRRGPFGARRVGASGVHGGSR
jgi:hypothetical protein